MKRISACFCWTLPKGITAQDLNIFSLAVKKGKGIVVLVNKWDLIPDKQTNTAKEYEEKN